MKIIYLFALLLINLTLQAQVGIGTTAPTTELDVNGNLRVRNLGSGTLVSDASGNITVAGPKIAAAGKVSGTGVAINIFGATVVRANEGDYNVTFTSAKTNANYIIMLANIDCGGACTNGAGSNDDPGIAYYNQTTSGFSVNIGDNDNGGTNRDDIDIEWMFVVYEF